MTFRFSEHSYNPLTGIQRSGVFGGGLELRVPSGMCDVSAATLWMLNGQVSDNKTADMTSVAIAFTVSFRK